MSKFDNDKAAELIRRYLAGQCNDAERRLVESWYQDYEAVGKAEGYEHESALRLARIRADLLRRTRRRSRVRSISVRAALVAATVLIFVLVSPFFRNSEEALILPGGNKAVLSLPDGRTIQLSEHQEGLLASEEGLRYADGSGIPQLEAWIGEDGDRRMEFLTVITPRGGRYTVRLEDGSVVQLNAQSELVYPLRFAKEQREVSVTGEAYFEVAHQPDRPFRVKLPNQEIEVLGTTFNVTAYQDEHNAATTLLEGSVRIATDAATILLAPGERSVLESGRLTREQVGDMEQVIAWKDGYFKFGGSLDGIMQKVGRWYDVDIVFDRNVDTKREFVGKIARDKPLQELLDVVAASGKLKYRIDGRRVRIMK